MYTRRGDKTHIKFGGVVGMATIGDILRFTVKGTLHGEDLVNVFFYEIALGSTGSLIELNMIQEWASEFQSGVVGSLSNELEYQSLLIENLTNGLTFAEEPISVQGGSSSPALPSSVALAVRLLRSSKVTRNGAKRFAGLGESAVDGNDVTLGGANIAAIEGFCGSLLILTDYDGNGSNANLEPVIVGRTLNAGGVYELDLSKINSVSAAQIVFKTSTQNTRKPSNS